MSRVNPPPTDSRTSGLVAAEDLASGGRTDTRGFGPQLRSVRPSPSALFDGSLAYDVVPARRAALDKQSGGGALRWRVSALSCIQESWSRKPQLRPTTHHSTGSAVRARGGGSPNLCPAGSCGWQLSARQRLAPARHRDWTAIRDSSRAAACAANEQTLTAVRILARHRIEFAPSLDFAQALSGSAQTIDSRSLRFAPDRARFAHSTA